MGSTYPGDPGPEEPIAGAGWCSEVTAMRKGSDLISKSHVVFETGERLARVRNLIFDDEANRVLGLLLDPPRRGGKSRVVRLRDASAIGPDAIIVPARSAIVRVGEAPEIR